MKARALLAVLLASLGCRDPAKGVMRVQIAAGGAIDATPATFRVELDDAQRARLAGPGPVRLRIAGMELPAGQGALFRLFVDRSDATAGTAAEGDSFAGQVSLLGQPAGARYDSLLQLKPPVAARLARAREPGLTLVPVGAVRVSFRELELIIGD